MIDLLYLAFNRRAFTEQTFTNLLEQTNWEHVSELVVYDDGSTDGTREYLDQAIKQAPVPHRLVHLGHGSPVAVMNHYVASTEAEWFMKTDSDIMLPPGYLDDMLGVLERNPDLELLGTEAGRMGLPGDDFDGVYTAEPCTHIGGVGLIKTSVLGTRRQMTADGRHGWTQHQHEYNPPRAWIHPDLRVCSLDQLPFEPWQGLARAYVDEGWARPWPDYFARWMTGYWDWWLPSEEVE